MAWEFTEAISNMMRIYHPNRVDDWINQAECLGYTRSKRCNS
jgi:hypothetical protein